MAATYDDLKAKVDELRGDGLAIELVHKDLPNGDRYTIVIPESVTGKPTIVQHDNNIEGLLVYLTSLTD